MAETAEVIALRGEGARDVRRHRDLPSSNGAAHILTGHQVTARSWMWDADARVRYRVGEPVVAVVARDKSIDYEPLPVVVDSEEALKPNAPLFVP